MGGGSNEYPQSVLEQKKEKIVIRLYTPVLLYKSGVQGGILVTDMLSLLEIHCICWLSCKDFAGFI